MPIVAAGLDLAKKVFQTHRVYDAGQRSLPWAGGSGRLACSYRRDWPPASFLTTSLCHGAGRYLP